MAESSAPSRGRTVLIIVAVVAALAIAAAALWLFLPRGASADPASGAPGATPSESATPTPTPIASATGAPVSPVPQPETTDRPIPPEAAPVAPTDPVVDGDGVTVSLASIESIEGQGVAPGETSGPAIRVTVRIVNDGEAPIDAGYVAVNAYLGADRAPAASVMEPGGAPMEGEIAPGAEGQGVYLFSVPADQRADVWIGVDYRVGSPTVMFRGALG